MKRSLEFNSPNQENRIDLIQKKDLAEIQIKALESAMKELSFKNKGQEEEVKGRSRTPLKEL